MNMVMQERFGVGGAMLVKLLGRPEVEAASFDAKAGRVRDIGIAQATYARVFFVALTLTASLATALVYGFGGVAAIKGTLAVGTVVALTQYLTRLYGPLTQLSNLNLDVMTALVSFERLFEVLDIVPMLTEDPEAVAIPRGPASIEFDHVDFTYPGAGEVSLASLESVAVLESGLVVKCFTTSPSESLRAGWSLSWDLRAPARRPSRPWSLACTTSALGPSSSMASTFAGPPWSPSAMSWASSPKTPISFTTRCEPISCTPDTMPPRLRSWPHLIKHR